MRNPMLDLLSANSNQNSNAYQELLKSNNPQEFVFNMLYNNPNSGAIMQAISQNGGSPKKAFYAMARQKGYDPDTLIKNYFNK